MAKTRMAIGLLALCVLSACHKAPEDERASALKSAADQQARQIEDQAKTQTQGMEQQADSLKAQAKQAGGYTGERLKVQADALEREADIIEKQANTRADGIRESAEAQAKLISSR